MYLFLFLSLHESCSNHRCYCGSHRAPSTSNSCHDTQPLPLPLPTCRQPPFQPFFSSFLHPILSSSSSSSSSSSWMEACIPLTSAEENVSIRGGRRERRDGLSAREQCHCASPLRGDPRAQRGQPIIFRTVFPRHSTLVSFLEMFCSSKDSGIESRPAKSKSDRESRRERSFPRVLFLFDGVVESGRFLLWRTRVTRWRQGCDSTQFHPRSWCRILNCLASIRFRGKPLNWL